MSKQITTIALSLLLAGASAAQTWTIDTEADWKAASSDASGFDFKDGFAMPEGAGKTWSSNVKSFGAKKKIGRVVFEQSPVWNQWEQIDDITPPGLRNAYVFLPVARGDYYVLAEYPKPKKIEYPRANMTAEEKKNYRRKIDTDPSSPNTGYQAWHSSDLKEWTHLGKVVNSRWVTTAEYADGKFYIYYDRPNDQDPHLVIDDNLKDGIVGRDMGCVFQDPTHGSDSAVFRDEDGTFHLIFEDWSPLNAQKHSWDSPLAGRVSSPDGINGFEFGEHPYPVDHRTHPTGKIGTFIHGASKAVNNGSPELSYDIHEPEQNAYGDYTMIKIGKHYHLFGDFHPAGEGKEAMRIARFTTDDLNKEFTFSGGIGRGFHPDPSVGFAEGKFYLVMQKETDFVSDGPWVDAIEARAGVDQTGDGVIDTWTDWQAVKERYSQKPGFARIVDVAPATLDTSALPAGEAFAVEFKVIGAVGEQKVLPEMDRIEIIFE